jgi:hypothetical protein
VGVLVEDEAEGDLGRRHRRDHRLEARALVAAAHAVDLAGGPGPDLLEHAAAELAGRDREADLAQEGLGVEAELLPVGAQHRGKLGTPS